MVDVRLLPSAIAVWAATWVATSMWLAAWAITALAVVSVSAAVGMVAWWWHEARGRVRVPGVHALTPGGSIRWAVAAALMSCACALVSAGTAMATHARDPTVLAIANGAARLEVVAELLDDPAASTARWATGRSGVDVKVRRVRQGDLWHDSAVRLYVAGAGWEDFARGDVVVVAGTVDASFRSEAPFAGTLRALAPDLVERPEGWVGGVRRIRESLVAASAHLSDQGRALVPGMAVGDDKEMSQELKEAMRTASLTHLTAVSGTHVAIMLGVVLWVVPGRRWFRAGTALAAMVVMVAVVGPQPSVLRAVAMASVAMAGMLSGRPGQSRAALCVVAMAMLVWDPWVGRSYGFALSVLATWGVIGPATTWVTVSKKRLRGDTRLGRFARRIVAVAAVPVAAQLMVSPVLVVLSGWIPMWGVVANVVAAPAIAPACLLGLGAAATSWWAPAIGSTLASWASVFTGWIAWVGTSVARWPGAQLPWPGGRVGALALAALLSLAAWRISTIWNATATQPDRTRDDPPRISP